MNNHNITLALAEARIADLQRAAATHSTATVRPRRHRRRLRALALLGTAATAALAALAPTGALAQPAHDAATPANAPHVDAIHRNHNPSATRPSITFTNPLGRSRGPAPERACSSTPDLPNIGPPRMITSGAGTIRPRPRNRDRRATALLDGEPSPRVARHVASLRRRTNLNSGRKQRVPKRRCSSAR
jgi:hypothetical protein